MGFHEFLVTALMKLRYHVIDGMLVYQTTWTPTSTDLYTNIHKAISWLLGDEAMDFVFIRADQSKPQGEDLHSISDGLDGT